LDKKNFSINDYSKYHKSKIKKGNNQNLINEFLEDLGLFGAISVYSTENIVIIIKTMIWNQFKLKDYSIALIEDIPSPALIYHLRKELF